MKGQRQRRQCLQFGFIAASGIATALFLCRPARPQVSYTSTTGGQYTQNFNLLLNSGNDTFDQNNATDANPMNGIVGWYAYRSGIGTQIVAGTGIAGSGNLYSFGSAGSTDRALGSVGSLEMGNLVWAVRISNDTGRDITGFSLGYTGEQWRYSGTASAQTVEFSYAIISDANLPSSTRLLNLAPTSGFTDLNDLDFTSPVISGDPGALNGNAVNRVFTPMTVSATIPAGHDIWFRWNDINHSGNDHGLATDDFYFTATQFQPVPAPPANVSAGIGGLVYLFSVIFRRKRTGKRRPGGWLSTARKSGTD